MDPTPTWPLETRLITIFKVDSFNVEHHASHKAYYQIWVDGFILDGFGDKVAASIQLSADDGDTSKVCEYENIYSVGSLHTLDTSLFGAQSGCFNFYGPDTKPLPLEKFDALNEYFITRARWEPNPESPDINNITSSSIASLCEKEDGSFVRIFCKVTGLKEICTKQGAVMGFATVGDLTGECQITLFGDIYPEVSNMIKSDEPLTIVGKLELCEQGPTILLSGSKCLVSISANQQSTVTKRSLADGNGR
jgi:predicted NodU family carbamoyl transferase